MLIALDYLYGFKPLSLERGDVEKCEPFNYLRRLWMLICKIREVKHADAFKDGGKKILCREGKSFVIIRFG